MSVRSRRAAAADTRIPPEAEAFADARAARGETLVALTADDAFAGFVALSDTLREGAPELVRELKTAGVRTIVLTGDNREAAARVAESVGADEAISECLPEDKAAAIRGLRERGALNGNKAVATIMSNIGLFRAFDKAGIGYETTTVGDRFVYECMQKNGYRLGGEQSGHIILRKYATTGDGLLTAIMLTEEMRDRKTTLSKLAEPVKLYPQTVKSIRVTSKEAALSDPDVQAEFDAINKEINGNGRALLRASGTEPVVRIMLECESEELCRKYTDRLFEIMNKRGYCCE